MFQANPVIPLLEELAIISIAGAAVTAVLARLRLPMVAGLLVAGALLGPFGLGLVRETEPIESLADVGVVLLLFTIGLEFSLDRLKFIFRRAALGGAAQVASTIAAAAGVATLLGAGVPEAAFYGFVFAMSSTAIVLRSLASRGELDAPHGRFIVAAQILQDLCVIPMVLLVPVLGNGGGTAGIASEILLALGKAMLVVAGSLVAARVLVPTLLRLVDASRSREVFLLAVVAIFVGMAWLTSLAGLSLALGAFLGGMVVAGTEFQHRAMGDIMPLRDVFLSVFFVSLGMLFDPMLIVEKPLDIALLLACFVVGKAVLAALSAAVMRFPARAAWLAGIGLAQFSEFGFVLIKLGEECGLTSPETASSILAAGILSMFLTPILMQIGPRITAGEMLLAPLSRLLGVRGIDQMEAPETKEKRVVIVGYGIAGKLVAQALKSCRMPHVALELNAETVRAARAAGEPVYYADATSVEALGHAGIDTALAAVVLINDPQAAMRVVDAIHRTAPGVPVMIRTRYFSERDRLVSLGASEVVAEEVEASMEVVARLLRRLEVPRNLIDVLIHEARATLMTSDRKMTLPRSMLPQHEALADLKIESLLVTERSFASGWTVQDLEIRQKTGALIFALRRQGRLMDSIDPGESLLPGDVVYLVGALEAVKSAIDLIEGSGWRQP